MQEIIIHPFDPIYDKDSEILILGTLPSVKSRENEFYYGHPQNRFWKILGALYEEDTPVSVEEKKTFLLRHHIALWDVIQSCEIKGSSDSSIKNVTANDISGLLSETKIHAVFCNGKKAQALFDRHIGKPQNLTATALPSSSPANAAWKLEKLIEEWSIIKTT